MIYEHLDLTRAFIVVDTETTGTNTKEDRIVELGFQLWKPVADCWKCCGGQLPPEEKDMPQDSSTCPICTGTGRLGGLEKEYRTLIKPGIPIPEEATAVHGITDAMVNACSTCGGQREACTCETFKPWPMFVHLAANLAVGFKDCDYGGKNVRFDLRIFAAEMKRAKVPWSYAGARIVDGDRLEALLNPRSLSHLYRKYTGKRLDGAHGALTDVRASADVIVGQMQATLQNDDDAGIKLPRNLDAIHQLQWPGWIDSEGLFRFNDKGVACFGRWGKHSDKPMKSAPADYYDFILKNDFSDEAKALAGQAKLGKFPTREL